MILERAGRARRVSVPRGDASACRLMNKSALLLFASARAAIERHRLSPSRVSSTRKAQPRLDRGLQPPGDLQREILFLRPRATHRAIVVAAMAGIDHDGADHARG